MQEQKSEGETVIRENSITVKRKNFSISLRKNARTAQEIENAIEFIDDAVKHGWLDETDRAILLEQILQGEPELKLQTPEPYNGLKVETDFNLYLVKL